MDTLMILDQITTSKGQIRLDKVGSRVCRNYSRKISKHWIDV